MEFCDAMCTERWHHETDNEDDGHKGATTPLGWTGDGGRFHGGSRLWRQAFPGAWARPLGSAFHRGLCGFRAPGLAGSSRFAPRCVQSPPRCWTTSGRGGASYSCCCCCYCGCWRPGPGTLEPTIGGRTGPLAGAPTASNPSIHGSCQGSGVVHVGAACNWWEPQVRVLRPLYCPP